MKAPSAEFRHLDTVSNSATIGGKEWRVRVLGVANPQIDIHHLARALLVLQKVDVDGKLLAKAKKMARRKSR